MTAPNRHTPADTLPKHPPAGLNGSARGAAGAGAGAGLLGTALPTRQRHNGFIALAVALIVGLAAIGASLYSSAGSKTPVVMVVHEVEVGQVLRRGDLTTVAVSGPLVAFSASRLPALLGQRAAVTLLPHMLLQQSMVTTGPTLQRGQAQVGVAVTSGRIPADGLLPGDVVRVVQLADKGTAGAADAPPRVLAERATVFASRQDPSASGSTLLTLVVADADSNAVAAASGAGVVALVKVAGSGS